MILAAAGEQKLAVGLVTDLLYVNGFVTLWSVVILAKLDNKAIVTPDTDLKALPDHYWTSRGVRVCEQSMIAAPNTPQFSVF